MRRFWTEVAVASGPDGHAITLDGKPLRTPGRLPLAVPFAPLAHAIADEWRRVEGEVAPLAMPLTGLANAAIERIAPAPLPFAATIAAYAESDLLCYRADAPPPLVARQSESWDPLLDWARARYDVHFEVVAGVMHQPQPPATIARLRDAVTARGAFELAGLSPVVTITGSLVAGLALIEGAADADTLWQAAQLDEDWQVEQWGHDADAAATRAAHHREFEAAVRFLELVRESDPVG